MAANGIAVCEGRSAILPPVVYVGSDLPPIDFIDAFHGGACQGGQMPASALALARSRFLAPGMTTDAASLIGMHRSASWAIVTLAGTSGRISSAAAKAIS